MTIDEARAALDAARGGVRVLYHPAGSEPEEGVLKHVTGRFVFVAYRGDHLGARASSPEDITLVEDGAPATGAAPVQGVLFGTPSALSAATAAGEGN